MMMSFKPSISQRLDPKEEEYNPRTGDNVAAAINSNIYRGNHQTNNPIQSSNSSNNNNNSIKNINSNQTIHQKVLTSKKTGQTWVLIQEKLGEGAFANVYKGYNYKDPHVCLESLSA